MAGLAGGGGKVAAASSAPSPSSTQPSLAARFSAFRERLASGRPCASASASAPAASAPFPTSTSSTAPTHLIVLVNGLFGSPANWDVAAAALATEMAARTSPHPPPPAPLIHASASNSRASTYDGIDTCGERLAGEVRRVAAAHPSLERISFLTHSMGGLISRYCVGALFDPRSRKIAGLEPCHFLTLATPHFGCDAEGVAQVPFVGWVDAALPSLGAALRGIAPTVAGALFGRTGRQFFLEDGSVGGGLEGGGLEGGGGGGGRGDGGGDCGGELPLLARLARDDPSRGLHFVSALASFRTRTAYANVSGDHLVGWANASLRPVGELPLLPPQGTARAAPEAQEEAEEAAAPSCGGGCRYVVREDPPEAAFFPDDPAARRLLARAGGGGGGGEAAEAALPASALARWHSEKAPAPHAGLGAPSSLDDNKGENGKAEAAAAAAPVPAAEAADDDGDDDGEGAAARAAAAAAAAAAEDLSAGLRAASPPLAAALARAEHPQAQEDAVAMVGVSHPARAAMVADMLVRLRALPWRRVDVCFRSGGGGGGGGGNGDGNGTGGGGPPLPLLRGLGLAHNNIQVTRRLFNSEGEAVVAHVARTIRGLDDAVREAEAEVEAGAAAEAPAPRR
jgi:hypothetical protein